MTISNAANTLFKPTPQQKMLDRTTEAAKQIISDEVGLRDANVLRLRALRQAREAQQSSSDAPAKPARRPRAVKSKA